MGITSDARVETATVMLAAASHADTSAATSAWIDVSSYKGTLAVTHLVGALTGSMVAKLRTATSDAGANAADITGATFTNVTQADKVQTVVVPASTGKYLQYVGTVTTGPCIVGVILRGTTGQAG